MLTAQVAVTPQAALWLSLIEKARERGARYHVFAFDKLWPWHGRDRVFPEDHSGDQGLGTNLAYCPCYGWALE